MKIHLFLALCFTAFFFCQCTFDEETATVKFASEDPFQETITPSQTFNLVGKEDNVVEGKEGTLIVIPAGSFVDGNGNAIDETIEIELTEAFALEDRLLSNLTATADGSLLQTDGMLYVNATLGGKQLFIDSENPIYIEIPTEKKIPGMQAYKGIRDENGNMNWIEPKALETFLVNVDMTSLNFLPNGFEETVEAGIPFRRHNTSSKQLIDSLYYAITPNSGRFSEVEIDFNEAYYNKHSKVVDGRYTEDSYIVKDTSYSYYDEHSQMGIDSSYSTVDTNSGPCGISPAAIKVINSSKYQNTLIATREFETRLQAIFNTCKDDILEVYVENLDKNLWELDSMAVLMLGESKHTHVFIDFYKQKLTNIENSKIYAALLKGYYQRKLEEVKSQLKEFREKKQEIENAEKEKFQKTVNDYKELLFKREKYRMERYSMEWTSTGWVGIIGVKAERIAYMMPLEVTVENSERCDRVYTYVVYELIESLYRLNTDDDKLFYVGNRNTRKMLIPEKEKATVISIGYAGDKAFFGAKKFKPGKDERLVVSIKEASLDKIKRKLREYNDYALENKIDKDLKYMAHFAKEKKRQEKRKEEALFIRKLVNVAYPCCAIVGFAEPKAIPAKYD